MNGNCQASASAPRKITARSVATPISAHARKQTGIRRSILTRCLFGGIGSVVELYGVDSVTRIDKHSPTWTSQPARSKVRAPRRLSPGPIGTREGALASPRRSGRLYDIIKEITCERKREERERKRGGDREQRTEQRTDGRMDVRTDRSGLGSCLQPRHSSSLSGSRWNECLSL